MPVSAERKETSSETAHLYFALEDLWVRPLRHCHQVVLPVPELPLQLHAGALPGDGEDPETETEHKGVSTCCTVVAYDRSAPCGSAHPTAGKDLMFVLGTVGAQFTKQRESPQRIGPLTSRCLVVYAAHAGALPWDGEDPETEMGQRG